MIAIVTGDRNAEYTWDNLCVITAALEEWRPDLTEIVEGGAHGVDDLSRIAAGYCGLEFHTEYAYWTQRGPKYAGPERNKRMLDEYEVKIVLAFHDDIKASKGTKNMVNQAIERSIPVWLYTFGKEDKVKLIEKVA